MILHQNRVKARTEVEAVDKIYDRHPEMQRPPSLFCVMPLADGLKWYEYVVVIEV